MSGRRFLGVITARAGSKRIPGKNLALLNGVPLIDYTLQAARDARRLCACVVSTDGEAIAQHVRGWGIAVPHMRPAELAGDHSPVVQALQHATHAFEQSSGVRVDAIVLLQPTSPFRTASDIDRAIALFERTDADTVTAVRACRDHPYWAWRKMGEVMAPFFTVAEIAMDRQRLPEAYAENGAIYIARRELVVAGTLYGERVVPYPMDELSSVDIDTAPDLVWAEFLLARRGAQREGPSG
jgi:CMP-N-acetylneuraminic acid synthetase